MRKIAYDSARLSRSVPGAILFILVFSAIAYADEYPRGCAKNIDLEALRQIYDNPGIRLVPTVAEVQNRIAKDKAGVSRALSLFQLRRISAHQIFRDAGDTFTVEAGRLPGTYVENLRPAAILEDSENDIRLFHVPDGLKNIRGIHIESYQWKPLMKGLEIGKAEFRQANGELIWDVVDNIDDFRLFDDYVEQESPDMPYILLSKRNEGIEFRALTISWKTPVELTQQEDYLQLNLKSLYRDEAKALFNGSRIDNCIYLITE